MSALFWAARMGPGRRVGRKGLREEEVGEDVKVRGRTWVTGIDNWSFQNVRRDLSIWMNG